MFRVTSFATALLLLVMLVASGCTGPKTAHEGILMSDEAAARPTFIVAELTSQEKKALQDNNKAAAAASEAFNDAKGSDADGWTIATVTPKPLVRAIQLPTATEYVSVLVTGPAVGIVTVDGQPVKNGQITAIELPKKTNKVEVGITLTYMSDSTDAIKIVHLVAGNYQHKPSAKVGAIRVIP